MLTAENTNGCQKKYQNYFIERGDAKKSEGKGEFLMRSELEYAKKMVLIAKLFRSELISEEEYEKIRRKLMDSYLIAGERSDDPAKAIA